MEASQSHQPKELSISESSPSPQVEVKTPGSTTHRKSVAEASVAEATKNVLPQEEAAVQESPGLEGRQSQVLAAQDLPEVRSAVSSVLPSAIETAPASSEAVVSEEAAPTVASEAAVSPKVLRSAGSASPTSSSTSSATSSVSEEPIRQTPGHTRQASGATHTRVRSRRFSTVGKSTLNLFGIGKTELPNKAIDKLGLSSEDSVANSERPETAEGVLLRPEYNALTTTIMKSSGSKSFKTVQEKLAAYDRTMNPNNKGDYSDFDAWQAAQANAAQECVVAIKNYQIASKEEYLFGESGPKVDSNVETMIKHLEASYPTSESVHFERDKKMQLLDTMASLKTDIDNSRVRLTKIAGLTNQDSPQVQSLKNNAEAELIKQSAKMVAHALEYERLFHGSHKVVEKARQEVGRYVKQLKQSAQEDNNAFFNKVGRESIIDLAFSTDPRCEDLYVLVCAQLKVEYSGENQQFLDKMQRFLADLHGAHEKGPLSLTQMKTILQEINAIYQVHISLASPQGQVNIPAVEQLKPIEQALAQLNAQCPTVGPWTISPEDFYKTASSIYSKAHTEIEGVVGRDPLARLKTEDFKKAKPEFPPAFFKAISP